jgi:hypothetical protein
MESKKRYIKINNEKALKEFLKKRQKNARKINRGGKSSTSTK